MHQSLSYSSMFSPSVKFSWKAHSTKILLHEIFFTWTFTARKFPNIRYNSHVLHICLLLSQASFHVFCVWCNVEKQTVILLSLWVLQSLQMILHKWATTMVIFWVKKLICNSINCSLCVFIITIYKKSHNNHYHCPIYCKCNRNIFQVASF